MDYFNEKIKNMSNEEYKKLLIDHIKEKENDVNENNLKLIREDLKNDGGKFVRFGLNEYGMLIGASTTYEDYYWVFIDDNLNVKCSSCVGKYEILDNPQEILPNLIKELEIDRFGVRRNAVRGFKKYKYDLLFTPLYI